MKLSEVKGERTAEVMAACLEPLSEIMEDTKLKEKKGFPFIAYVGKHYKDEIVTIYAAVEGISEEEYRENLTPAKFIDDITDLFSDETTKALFPSAQTKEEKTSAGSAQEDTQVTQEP